MANGIASRREVVPELAQDGLCEQLSVHSRIAGAVFAGEVDFVLFVFSKDEFDAVVDFDGQGLV
jgi:hypothetical protein